MNNHLAIDDLILTLQNIKIADKIEINDITILINKITNFNKLDNTNKIQPITNYKKHINTNHKGLCIICKKKCFYMFNNINYCWIHIQQI